MKGYPAPLQLQNEEKIIGGYLSGRAAGFLGLPGPRYTMSSNPYDPPLRLDQWLQLRYKHRTKHKILPYRRYP